MKQTTLRTLRRYHHCLGMFFAPWILLFAVSGALQTFRLQEPKGYGGTPPEWMVWLSSVHKDQGPPREPKANKPKPPEAVPDMIYQERPKTVRPAESRRPNPLPLKIFVVLLAISLAVSTIIGVVIGLANASLRRVSIVLLVLGTVIPPVLLWL